MKNPFDMTSGMLLIKMFSTYLLPPGSHFNFFGSIIKPKKNNMIKTLKNVAIYMPPSPQAVIPSSPDASGGCTKNVNKHQTILMSYYQVCLKRKYTSDFYDNQGWVQMFSTISIWPTPKGRRPKNNFGSRVYQ